MWNRTPPAIVPAQEPLLASWRIEDVGVRGVRFGVGVCTQDRMTAEIGYDFVVAVNEIVSNVVEHAGGYGSVRLWMHDGTLVCEVADEGPGVLDRTLGTRWPVRSARGGYGLWMARQLCLAVHGVTTEGAGTTVWLHGACVEPPRAM